MRLYVGTGEELRLPATAEIPMHSPALTRVVGAILEFGSVSGPYGIRISTDLLVKVAGPLH